MLLCMCVRLCVTQTVCVCAVFRCVSVGFVHMCVFVGWDVGGLENVRNVEESNQNVPLCGQQKKKAQRKRNIVASSWE